MYQFSSNYLLGKQTLNKQAEIHCRKNNKLLFTFRQLKKEKRPELLFWSGVVKNVATASLKTAENKIIVVFAESSVRLMSMVVSRIEKKYGKKR